MPTPPPSPVSDSRADRDLEALFGLAAKALESPSGLRVRRVQIERTSTAKPLAWLQAQNANEHLYWSSRERDLQVAALGCADELRMDGGTGSTVAAIIDRLTGCEPGVRYFGGLRFSSATPADDRWATFGCARFIVPRIEYGLHNDRPFLALNFTASESLEDLRESVRALVSPEPPNETDPPPLPAPEYRVDRPDAAQWEARIDIALMAFAAKTLQKIVLARRASFHFSRPLDALTLLRRLRRVTPECFHFCFQSRSGHHFIGASPERLYARQGRRISSEAVAGTRPRGANLESDLFLSNQLRSSEKDLREHHYVRDAIREALQPLCDRLDASQEPGLLQLARGQHLYTAFAGELRAGVGDDAIVAALHPTPAVCGCPTAEALRCIAEWEGFDRGWYAGPVGWIGHDHADFAVAIRSGLVENERLDLFPGAGIVAGSTPRAEWE